MGFPYVIVFCVLLQLNPIHTLHCYSCQQMDDPYTCNNTIVCLGSQTCFLDVQGGIYNLGCADTQHCGGVDGVGMVGRSSNDRQHDGHTLTGRQSSHCRECCSTDGCNSELCAHQKPTQCVDDKSVDCARLNSLFHICQQDKQQASLVCPHYCNLCTMVHGNWTPWSALSNCAVTCGKGAETRSRSCTNPAPANGGRDCDGNAAETKACQMPTCPIHGSWSLWSPWGSCSVSCDVGIQRRDRACTNPYPSHGGDHCFGESRNDRICMTVACSDGGWSSWTSWGSCSETCGGGIRPKTRNCSNPEPSLLGKPCAGTSMQVSLCNKQTCPGKSQDCIYSIWGDWDWIYITLVFPHIIQNYGNGYSTSTGKFTCSVPGIYSFSVQISKKHFHDKPIFDTKCYIYLNSVQVVGADQSPHSFASEESGMGGYSLSVSTSLHLNRNDFVKIGDVLVWIQPTS